MTERTERLEFDIDCRMVNLRREMLRLVSDREEQTIATVLMRAAYGRGYIDALCEPTRGQLCRDHGYVVPRKGAS